MAQHDGHADAADHFRHSYTRDKSQLVRRLETYLDAPLFQRLPRGLVLTEQGRDWLPELSAGFDLLGAGADRQGPPNFEPAGDLFGRLVQENREIPGLLALLDFAKSFGGKPPLEQFSYCGSSARHPLCKTPCIDGPEFRGREHDLKAFASMEFTHRTLPRRTASKA